MISKDKPFIFDGAMGTYYFKNSKKNVYDKCEYANIYDQCTIRRIHGEYISAGCDAVRTNTFSANRANLECDTNTLKEVIEKGYKLACDAVKGTNTKVFACIGPVGAITGEKISSQYIEIADLFLNLGADNFIFETFSDDDYLYDVCKYIKSQNPRSRIITGIAVLPDGYTRSGRPGQKIYNSLVSSDHIDAAGFNCCCGPLHMNRLIKSITKTSKPLLVMPNAGYPEIINNRSVYDASESYFANMMKQSVTTNAAIIGGCCGTTPAHIAMMVSCLSAGFDPGKIKVNEPDKIYPGITDEGLTEKIQNRKKIIAVEIDPPTNTDCRLFMDFALKLNKKGIDAITIADCPIAKARADSSIMACKVSREIGIRTIPHITCRDRNINAIKALLLGLGIQGISDVLIITGDPVPIEKRDEVKSVFAFNSVILAEYISELNKSTMEKPFKIHAALNINAVNFKKQLDHALKKQKRGVSMFFTQPLLSEYALENLKRAKEILDSRILAGILPIVSYRNACFLNNEISGINISDEITEKYIDCDKEKADDLAVEISVGMAQKARDHCDGYYIITPFKRIDLIENIIDRVSCLVV